MLGLKIIGESAKNLAGGFANYFGVTQSFDDIVKEYSKPIENTKYKVRKSTALEKKLAAGKTISNFAIGLVDSKHGLPSITIQISLK